MSLYTIVQGYLLSQVTQSNNQSYSSDDFNIRTLLFNCLCTLQTIHTLQS